MNSRFIPLCLSIPHSTFLRSVESHIAILIDYISHVLTMERYMYSIDCTLQSARNSRYHTLMIIPGISCLTAYIYHRSSHSHGEDIFKKTVESKMSGGKGIFVHAMYFCSRVISSLWKVLMALDYYLHILLHKLVVSILQVVICSVIVNFQSYIFEYIFKRKALRSTECCV